MKPSESIRARADHIFHGTSDSSYQGAFNAAILEHLDKEAEGQRADALWHTPESVQTSAPYPPPGAEPPHGDRPRLHIEGLTFVREKPVVDSRYVVVSIQGANLVGVWWAATTREVMLLGNHFMDPAVLRGVDGNAAPDPEAVFEAWVAPFPRRLEKLVASWRETAQKCAGPQFDSMAGEAIISAQGAAIAGCADELEKALKGSPPSEAFSPGDVVQLKSGGPLMTVTTSEDAGAGEVTCVWFNSSGTEDVELFEAVTLRRAESR